MRKSQPTGAFAELLHQDTDRDDVPFGGWAGEMLPPAPPVESAPLAPPRIPPPDWHAEAHEQQRRDTVNSIREPAPPRPYDEDTEPRPARPGGRDEGAAA